LASECMETNMLLLLESGRSHPDIGTKVVQFYLYTVCILYPIYCIQDTLYIVQYTGYIYDIGYSNNL
jgi:hypothetical protein